jgi:hypothetical protein
MHLLGEPDEPEASRFDESARMSDLVRGDPAELNPPQDHTPAEIAMPGVPTLEQAADIRRPIPLLLGREALVDNWLRLRDGAIREALAEVESDQPAIAAQARLRLPDLYATTVEELNLLSTPIGREIAHRLENAGWSPAGVILWFTGPNERLDEDRDERPVDYVRRLEAAIANAEAQATGSIDPW